MGRALQSGTGGILNIHLRRLRMQSIREVQAVTMQPDIQQGSPTVGACDSALASPPPLTHLEEIQVIARRLVGSDRAAVPVLCASLGHRLAELMKLVGEHATIDASVELKEHSIRWAQLFPVDADVLNEHVASFVAARSSNARKEVSTSLQHARTVKKVYV
jgi:hypothetical protein